MWSTSEIVGLIAEKMVEQDPGTKFSDLVEKWIIAHCKAGLILLYVDQQLKLLTNILRFQLSQSSWDLSIMKMSVG